MFCKQIAFVLVNFELFSCLSVRCIKIVLSLDLSFRIWQQKKIHFSIGWEPWDLSVKANKLLFCSRRQVTYNFLLNSELLSWWCHILCIYIRLNAAYVMWIYFLFFFCFTNAKVLLLRCRLRSQYVLRQNRKSHSSIKETQATCWTTLCVLISFFYTCKQDFDEDLWMNKQIIADHEFEVV